MRDVETRRNLSSSFLSFLQKISKWIYFCRCCSIGLIVFSRLNSTKLKMFFVFNHNHRAVWIMKQLFSIELWWLEATLLASNNMMSKSNKQQKKKLMLHRIRKVLLDLNLAFSIKLNVKYLKKLTSSLKFIDFFLRYEAANVKFYKILCRNFANASDLSVRKLEFLRVNVCTWCSNTKP